MAVSAIRRYTPPTCTLEILAKQSVLSRWTDRTVFKDVRFHLSFDGPQRPHESRVTVRGDRDQLEGLCDLVEQYVQQVVGGQAEAVYATLLQPTAPIYPAHAPADRYPADRYPLPPSPPLQPDLNGHTSPRRREGMNGLDDSAPIILWSSQRREAGRGRSPYPPEPSPTAEPSSIGVRLANGLGLRPAGGLGHWLAFGSLATGETGASVQLSTVELFDLANALEEYRLEAIALPSSETSGWLGKTPPWMRVAAVAVLAVGSTTAIASLLYTQNAGLVSNSANQEEVLSQVESLPTADAPADQGVARESAPATVDAEAALDDPEAEPSDDQTADDQTAASTSADTPAASVPTDRPLPPPPSPSAPVTLQPQPAPGASTTPGTAPAGTLPTEPESIPPELAALPPVEAPAGTAASAPEVATSLQRAARPEALSDSAGQTLREAAPPSRVVSLPQVNEVRAYFQERWQPPADLDRTLEYRLTLGTDGSLQRVVPLGQTARLYLDQAGFPSPTAEFVSPLRGDRLPTIRLALGRDGEVRTFLETMTIPPETP
ncbi:MAG: DUF4335 domain-containing protein [Synechococcales bacterium]|nr:DUF4335 domain-containing protein [Synechococcales bacterium]